TPLPGAGHAEPGRAGRDVSVAGSATGPVHVPDRAELPVRGGGGPDRAHDDRRRLAPTESTLAPRGHHQAATSRAPGPRAGPHLFVRRPAGAEVAAGRPD